MDEAASKYLFLCLLFVLIFYSSEIPQPKEFHQNELKREQEQIINLHHRDLLHNVHYKTTQHDTINPPTSFPTSPVTVPPDSIPTPTIVTVPSTNPTSTPLAVPSTNPVPITSQVTTPGTTPGTQPITNPVTTYPAPSTGVPVTNPVTPPATGSSPAVPGQSWCVARSGTPDTTLQAALDYACGIGGADCLVIQEGASCYNPNTLENHASFAFNSYYQKNPVPTSCDFGGTAMVTNMNPSTGTCIYPASSSASSSPLIATNPTPTSTTNGTPTTSSGANVPGSIYPPTVMNASNPASSGYPTVFGESPPSINSPTSTATTLQPFIGGIVLVTSIFTWKICSEHVEV